MRQSMLWAMMAALFWLALSNIFLRSSMGVLAPELARDLSLSPELLGAIASSFFLAYALFQIPTGMMLDRFGPRRSLLTLYSLTVIGAFLFAWSPNGTVMMIARILMGLGCAGVFSGAFILILRFYPPERFTTIGGNLNSFGMLGTLLATAPLAYLITDIGWRASFTWIAGGVALIALMNMIFVRDWPPGEKSESRARHEDLSQVLTGVWAAIKQPGVLAVATGGIALSAGNIFLGIWGGPYLNDVHEQDEIGRGEVLIYMAIAGVFGHLLYGRAARWFNTLKGLVMAGATGIVAIMTCMALIPDMPLIGATVLFALLAFVCGFPTIMMAHGRALMPEHLAGRGMTVVNTGVMIAIALMQLAVGAVVGFFTPADAAFATEESYRAAFAFIAGMGLITLFFYRKAPNPKPAEIARK